MPFSDKEIRRFMIIFLVLILMTFSFLILRPLILSIFGGLILAYVFFPLYKRINKLVRFKNLSASLATAIIILLIFVPLWFMLPLIVQQSFDVFTFTQNIDIKKIIGTVFPSSSEQFQRDTTVLIINSIGKLTSGALNEMIEFLLNLPKILLHFAVIIFVFFFALRDCDKLKLFFSGISPLKKEKEQVLANQFRDVTRSIIFGYVVVGIIQGIAAGIGFFAFGVNKALFLTILAVFASLLPMVGPWLVWMPVAIFLLVSAPQSLAIGFIAYNAIVVSFIDNILRPLIISKRTGIPSVMVLIGMIGGLLVFGIIGIFLGPLIVAYLILFLKAYKEKTFSDLFVSE